MENIIKMLTTPYIGEYSNSIICQKCDSTSMPYGLGKKDINKIQLVRMCRSCNHIFWYWEKPSIAVKAFSED